MYPLSLMKNNFAFTRDVQGHQTSLFQVKVDVNSFESNHSEEWHCS